MKKYKKLKLEMMSTYDVFTSSVETDFIPFGIPNYTSISLNEELTSSPNPEPFELEKD